MNGFYNFIVKPIDNRYNNEISIGDKKLIVNTQIESFKHISRKAIVVSTPITMCSDIKVGDEIIVHHNIFRRWYDIKGVERNGSGYFKDDMYIVYPDQVYLYKKNNKWLSFNDRCFIAPVKNDDQFDTAKTKKLVGILKIGNSRLESLGITPGDTVGFRPSREWEFNLNEELLYCMKSNDIVIKYERKENQTQYNPSWTSSS